MPRRTALALAGTLLLILAMHQYWLAQVMEENETLEASIRKNQEMVEMLERKIEKGEGLEGELARLEGGGRERNPFGAMDPARVAGHLAERISGLDPEGLLIKTYQVLTTRPQETHTEVTVMLNLMTSIGPLHKLLTELEGMRRFVSVTQLEVLTAPGRKGPDLEVRLHLTVLTGAQTNNNQTASAS
ncbi:MAG TPA: GspMb/PilO family protein [Methanomassiliicoccales archaeon]|nr:GspMb/PilO family protein [Methanomassiliicoccales archaeon]